MRPPTLPPLLALALPFVLLGCNSKPIAEVPSLSAAPAPDTRERDHPGRATLAPTLALLDARVTDPVELERRRAEFEAKLVALVPAAPDREKLGLQSVLSWHQVYSRGRASWLKAANGLDERLRKLARPQKGFELRIDDKGVARECPVTPEGAACRAVLGPAQLDGDGARLAEQLDTLLEAHWFLTTGLDTATARLTPSPR